MTLALEDEQATGGFGRFSPIAFVVVLIAAAASLFPFAYLVITSFLPVDGPVGSLWTRLFVEVPVVSYMINSAIVSSGATLLVLAVSSMAGFGLAKLPFSGSRAVFLMMVGSLTVPAAAIIIPNYFNFAAVNGIGTYWGPILVYAAAGVPFAVVLMTNFFHGIPDELVESAIIDGASYWQVFFFIMVRLATPALMTVGVLTFLGSWNDLLVGLLFLPDPGMRTISVGIAALQGVRSTNIELILTGSLLSAIPPIVTFLLFQKYLVAGITAGITK
jgi:ABC-type glycerol-3-phosphate transport system permease component